MNTSNEKSDESKRFLEIYRRIKVIFNNIDENEFEEYLKLINKVINTISNDDFNSESDSDYVDSDDLEKIKDFNNEKIYKIYELFKYFNKSDIENTDIINKKFVELCNNNNLQEINKFLFKNKNKIDFTYIDENEFSGIYYLLKNQRINIIDELISLDKDIGYNIIFGDGETLLLLAIKNSNMFLVKKILDKIDIETLNHENEIYEGYNAFYFICKNKNLNLIKKMLTFEKLNVNSYDYEKNETVLCHLLKNAAYENEIINILDKGFNLFKPSYFLQAISLNLKNVSNKLFDLFYEKIDFSLKNENHSNCLMLSIFNNMKNLSLKIIKTGKVNFTEEDNANHTVFTYACQESEKEIALELLKYDTIDINHKIDDKSTPLILCCDRKSIKDVALELLKRENIDVSVINDKKETALLVASREGLEDIAIEILKKKDSKPNHLDDQNKTILYWATYNNLYNLSYELLNNYDCLPYLIESNINDQALIHACKNNMDDIALMILKDERVEWWESNKKNISIFDYIFKQNMNEVIIRIIDLMDSEFVINNIQLLKKKILESHSSKRIIYKREISKKLDFFNSNYDICYQLYEYI